MAAHSNSFLAVRIVAALAVIVDHCQSVNGEAPLYIQRTNAFVSQLGLSAFFVLSGFLIFQSLERSNDWARFFAARTLRLMPALVAALIFTSGLTLVWFGNWRHLDSHIEYIIYNMGMFFWQIQYGIDGLFDGRPRTGVNDSLWTLAYEFWLYVILFISFIFSERLRFALIVFLLAIAVTIPLFFPNDYEIPFGPILKVVPAGGFAFNFLTGALLAAVWPFVRAYWLVLGLAAAMAARLTPPGQAQIGLLSVSLICFASVPLLKGLERFGDPSYGMYVYAFPIQQICALSFSDLGVQLAVTLVASITMGYLSWHVLEAPALRQREKLAALLARLSWPSRRSIS